jgi:maltose-binding protein MalE
MKIDNLHKFSEAMKKIAPVIEETGFIVSSISDNSNPSWDFIAINILPKPKEGSIKGKILEGELG